MLDIKFIRENPDLVRRSLENRCVQADLDGFLEADASFRSIVEEVNGLKHRKNLVAREIPNEKDANKKAELVARMKDLNLRLKDLDDESTRLDSLRNEIRLYIPNMPLNDVPVGEDASSNQVVSTWGEKRTPPFHPKGHVEIGSALKMLDMERGAKVTGSGFYILRDKLARMERALINLMMDIHTTQGYTEIWAPALANSSSMLGTGQLPKFEDDMYRIPSDDLYMIPTAEVTLTNMNREEILDLDDMPLRYQAFSPCFRREAGRHTGEEGMIRVHQFSKVELVSIVDPENSALELEKLTDDASEVLRRLDLPHRKVLLCTGDMTFSSAKTYDLEVHCPYNDRWMEVSSCSLFTDFQARRSAIKFRRQPHLPSEFVHTLNGSGLAIGRTMVAIMENYQTEEGGFAVPEALRPYMGGAERIEPLTGRTI
ncbi:MAG: serine--tRNA ligase [Candidatus Thermoplasmatota archaeon]|nr:serine--tRNA ligase [Candidatus Thermoplasmatota archaeon]